MDSMGLWVVIGAAVAIAAICVVLLQKKAGEAKGYVDELNILKSQLQEKDQQGAELQANEAARQDMQNKIGCLSATLQSAKEQNSQLQSELAEAREKLKQLEDDNNERTEIAGQPDQNSGGAAAHFTRERGAAGAQL